MTTTTTALAKNSVIKLDNAAGSLTAITTYTNAFQFGRSKEIDADTTLGDRAESHTVGLEDNGSVGIEWNYSSTAWTHLCGIWGSSSTQTLEQNWAGAGSGRRKGTAETVFTKWELSWEMGSTIKMSTEHKVSGDITHASN